MTHSPLVIVNADDFGLNAQENRVIVAAFEAGLISSATAMANMPAFAEACAQAHERGFAEAVGLHFNLTYGAPLSTAIRNERLFCDHDGQFDLSLPRHALRISSDAAEAVRGELQAQWQACLAQGIRPSHIDSHQHVHNLWPIAPIVARFAGEQGVAVRLARNLGHNIGPAKRAFKLLLNRRLTGLAGCTASSVCTPRDLHDGVRIGGPLEIVAHPTQLDDGAFGDAYLPDGESLGELLDRTLAGYRRISYRELAALGGVAERCCG